VADARRTKTRVINEDTLATVARNAGINFDFEGPDAFRVEDALTEALARFYDQRADALRSERRIGRSGGLGQFFRDVLGVAVSQAPAQSAPTHASAHARPSDLTEHVSTLRAEGGVDGQVAEDGLQTPNRAYPVNAHTHYIQVPGGDVLSA